MDEAEEFDPGLIITTRCLTGLALVFFLARVSVQAVKRCDIRWDSLTLVASLVSLFSVSTLISINQGRIEQLCLTFISTDNSNSRSYTDRCRR